MLLITTATLELPYEYPMLPIRLLSAALDISRVTGSRPSEAPGRTNDCERGLGFRD